MELSTVDSSIVVAMKNEKLHARVQRGRRVSCHPLLGLERDHNHHKRCTKASLETLWTGGITAFHFMHFISRQRAHNPSIFRFSSPFIAVSSQNTNCGFEPALLHRHPNIILTIMNEGKWNLFLSIAIDRQLKVKTKFLVSDLKSFYSNLYSNWSHPWKPRG